MQVSAKDLAAMSNAPAPLPGEVQPKLSLVEEVVLLGVGAAAHSAVSRAARVGARAYPEGPRDYRAAVASLGARGMVSHAGVLHKRSATAAARLKERTARVHAIVERAATPVGRDAELLVLLALAQALQLENPREQLRARLRLGSIGVQGLGLPAVAAVASELRVDTASELADRLLPAPNDLQDANFDPGMSAGMFYLGDHAC